MSGRIVDEKGAGLPGVNVIVKGTTTGTQTDIDGRYTIQTPDGATLAGMTFCAGACSTTKLASTT